MTTTAIDLIPVIVEREHATLPDWCDSWGIKSVQPDLRTYGGYQWPFPGQTAMCDPTRLVPENDRACPWQSGDGLCVATSWNGMASGSIPARTMLLVAYASADVLGRDDVAGKVRVTRVAVVALVDGQRLIREAGTSADLRGANPSGADLTSADLTRAKLTDADLSRADLTGAVLTGADLTRADLSRADLTGAVLSGAKLTGADLYRADLTSAVLSGADLTRADLSGADLTGAYLTDADLTRADLTSADLTDADLRGADLYRANLTGADLTGADLSRADLYRANLYGAKHDATTTWPVDYKSVTARTPPTRKDTDQEGNQS